MPEVLVQAQRQGLGHPELCVQLSQGFLQRELVDKHFSAFSRDPNSYRETAAHYRTRQQSIEARLINGVCLSRLEQYDAADRTLDHAQQEASVLKLATLEAIAHYHLARNFLLRPHGAEQAKSHLVTMQKLVRQEALSNPQLPLYAQLLHAAYAVTTHQNELAGQILHQLDPTQNPGLPPQLAVTIFTLSGDLQNNQQHDELALAYYSDALKMATSLNDSLAQAQLADRISQLFLRRGDLTQAIHYGELSCDRYQQVGNPSWLAQELLKLAKLIRKQGDNNLALSLLFNALDLYHNMNHPLELANLNLEIGRTYLAMGSANSARAYLTAASNSYRVNRDHAGELNTLLTLAELHLQQREAGSAIPLLERELEKLADVQADPRLYYLLSQAYEAKGQYQPALKNFKRFAASYQMEENDSRNQGRRQFQDNYQQVDLERRNKALVKQQQESETQNARYRWLLGLVMLGCITLSYLLLRLWATHRREQEAFRILKQQEFISPLTSLANQRQLDEDLRAMQAAPASYNHQEWDPEQDESPPPAARQLIHIHLAALDNAMESMGQAQAHKLFSEVGETLRAMSNTSDQIYHLTTSRFLLLQSVSTAQPLQQMVANLFERLATLMVKHGVDAQVTMGLVGYPFLTRCPWAIQGKDAIELSLLALAAAEQIGAQSQQSAWVELSAIDCQQAAFFNGEIRARAVQAIEMGLVKVNASHGKPWIDWARLSGQV
ncbi:MAG: hypothetical protein ACRCRW_08985 [Aeromonadaceae bacterium]